MLGNEMLDQLTKMIPPTDGTAFAITAGMAQIVFPHVFTGNRIGHLTEVDHLALKGRADDELFRLTQRDRVPLITNEGLTESGLASVKGSGETNLRGRCKAAGLDVFTPQEFLAHPSVPT